MNKYDEKFEKFIFAFLNAKYILLCALFKKTLSFSLLKTLNFLLFWRGHVLTWRLRRVWVVTYMGSKHSTTSMQYKSSLFWVILVLIKIFRFGMVNLFKHIKLCSCVPLVKVILFVWLCFDVTLLSACRLLLVCFFIFLSVKINLLSDLLH